MIWFDTCILEIASYNTKFTIPKI